MNPALADIKIFLVNLETKILMGNLLMLKQWLLLVFIMCFSKTQLISRLDCLCGPQLETLHRHLRDPRAHTLVEEKVGTAQGQ